MAVLKYKDPITREVKIVSGGGNNSSVGNIKTLLCKKDYNIDIVEDEYDRLLGEIKLSLGTAASLEKYQ
jgi:hypothetical protein